MTVARVYTMGAKAGRSAELEAGLVKLADVVTGLAGSQGVDLLRDAGNEHLFLFVEKWDSIESHEAAREEFAKLDMASVMEALDGPPDGAYFDYLLSK
jgi:heme oxygenase (mycobilin-producing)